MPFEDPGLRGLLVSKIEVRPAVRITLTGGVGFGVVYSCWLYPLARR